MVHLILWCAVTRNLLLVLFFIYYYYLQALHCPGDIPVIKMTNILTFSNNDSSIFRWVFPLYLSKQYKTWNI